MDTEHEITENRARIKSLELKMQALLNILSKEGIIVKKDIDTEIDDFLEDDGKPKEEKDPSKQEKPETKKQEKDDEKK